MLYWYVEIIYECFCLICIDLILSKQQWRYFLFSDFTRMNTVKHKSVSFMSLLDSCFPFISITLTLTWTLTMVATPGSENLSLTTLQLSLSLLGSVLCLGWHSHVFWWGYLPSNLASPEQHPRSCCSWKFP